MRCLNSEPLATSKVVIIHKFKIVRLVASAPNIILRRVFLMNLQLEVGIAMILLLLVTLFFLILLVNQNASTAILRAAPMLFVAVIIYLFAVEEEADTERFSGETWVEGKEHFCQVCSK